MLSLIGTLLLGLLVGALARLLMPGEQPMGWLLTSLLGVAGAFLASQAGQAAGWYAPGDQAGWLASVVGALVLLIVVARLRGPGDGPPT